MDIDYNTVLLHVPRLRRSLALWSFDPDPGVAPDAAALLTQLCAVWLPSHTSPGDPSPPLRPRQGESDPLSRPEFFLGPLMPPSLRFRGLLRSYNIWSSPLGLFYLPKNVALRPP